MQGSKLIDSKHFTSLADLRVLIVVPVSKRLEHLRSLQHLGLPLVLLLVLPLVLFDIMFHLPRFLVLRLQVKSLIEIQ